MLKLLAFKFNGEVYKSHFSKDSKYYAATLHNGEVFVSRLFYKGYASAPAKLEVEEYWTLRSKP